MPQFDPQLTIFSKLTETESEPMLPTLDPKTQMIFVLAATYAKDHKFLQQVRLGHMLHAEGVSSVQTTSSYLAATALSYLANSSDPECSSRALTILFDNKNLVSGDEDLTDFANALIALRTFTNPLGIGSLLSVLGKKLRNGQSDPARTKTILSWLLTNKNSHISGELQGFLSDHSLALDAVTPPTDVLCLDTGKSFRDNLRSLLQTTATLADLLFCEPTIFSSLDALATAIQQEAIPTRRPTR